MRNLLALFLAVILVAGSVLAGPAFGVRGGLNLANISEDPKAEGISYNMRTGIAVGGNLEFSLTHTDNITLRGEAMYVMKGTKTEGTLNGVNYKSTLKVDEIVLAPILVFRFPSDGFTPFLQAGPELGLNVSHSYSATAEANGQSASSSGDLTDWAGTNFGLILGGGIAVPAGQGEVLFEARYDLGLSNMYTGSGGGTDKTNGIQIIIGYNIKVPTKK
jgi:hypothetical protein